MKKVFAFLSVLVMVFLFTACNGGSNKCPECGGTYTMTDHQRLTTGHKEAHDYYYYTYQCVDCGHVEKIKYVK